MYLPCREAFLQHAEQFGSLVNHDFGGVVMPLKSTEEHRAALGVALTWVGVSTFHHARGRAGSSRAVKWLDYGTDNDPSTPDADGTQNNGKVGSWRAPAARRGRPVHGEQHRPRVLQVSYAQQRGCHWAFGGTVKFVRQSISRLGVRRARDELRRGLDAGAIYMVNDAVTLSGRDARPHDHVHQLEQRRARVRRADDGDRLELQLRARAEPAAHVGGGPRLELRGRKFDSQLKMGPVTADLRTGLGTGIAARSRCAPGFRQDLNFGAGVRYRHFGVDYAASLNRFFAADDPRLPGRQEPRRDAPRVGVLQLVS